MLQRRSRTGNHLLLPADTDRQFVAQVSLGSETATLSSWTFGSGTVIWKIWPAVLLHTLVAAAVVSYSILSSSRGGVSLGIPNVMLTVLGVVIGFVLAYRVSSGYDRYWLGRCYWSDLVRNCRTLSRLIWFHIPLRINSNSSTTPEEEIRVEDRVMREKRMALDLVLGFAVAVKHHLRGEMGIYYEDLYQLLRPLHEEPPHISRHNSLPSSSMPNPPVPHLNPDPVVPPVNAYGTFDAPTSPTTTAAPHLRFRNASSRSSSRSSSHSSGSSIWGHRSHHPHAPLLPRARENRHKTLRNQISLDLVPFLSLLKALGGVLMHPMHATSLKRAFYSALPSSSHPPPNHTSADGAGAAKPNLIISTHHPTLRSISSTPSNPNIPLETLRCLSEYFCVLEERGVVPGSSMGSMVGTIQMFEDVLSGCERILTTPLPWIYSVHIRHTIWIYLFFLPFQLVDAFGWYTIPGVALAAFFYLGFLAAGEEIEQPFGYDENDLDLESFVHVIHADMRALRRTRARNVVLDTSSMAGTGEGGGRRGEDVGGVGVEGVCREQRAHTGRERMRCGEGVVRGDDGGQQGEGLVRDGGTETERRRERKERKGSEDGELEGVFGSVV